MPVTGPGPGVVPNESGLDGPSNKEMDLTCGSCGQESSLSVGQTPFPIVGAERKGCRLRRGVRLCLSAQEPPTEGLYDARELRPGAGDGGGRPGERGGVSAGDRAGPGEGAGRPRGWDLRQAPGNRRLETQSLVQGLELLHPSLRDRPRKAWGRDQPCVLWPLLRGWRQGGWTEGLGPARPGGS